MTVLEELRKVVALNGDTYSTAEVIGLLSRAADEIERLERAVDAYVEEMDSRFC